VGDGQGSPGWPPLGQLDHEAELVLGPNGQRELGRRGKKKRKIGGLLGGLGQKLKRNRKIGFRIFGGWLEWIQKDI
jgi:hypothetical protein